GGLGLVAEHTEWQSSEGIERWALRPSVVRLTQWLSSVVVPAYRWLHRYKVSDWLNGSRPLGHPVHPALSDLPIGFWIAAPVMFVIGHNGAAATLLALGVLAALATIV